jgi:hypothetical protein
MLFLKIKKRNKLDLNKLRLKNSEVTAQYSSWRSYMLDDGLIRRERIADYVWSID